MPHGARASTQRERRTRHAALPERLTMTTIRQRRPHPERRRRAAVHLLLPPGRLHPRTSRAPTSARESPAAKDAIAQILTNSRMCAEGHRPICQDTGIVIVFLEDRHGRALGRRHDGRRGHGQRRRAPRATTRPGQQAARVDVADPAGKRSNTKDNTPAVVHMRARAGQHRRRDGRGQGRRLGEQVEVRDAQSRPTRSSTGC